MAVVQNDYIRYLERMSKGRDVVEKQGETDRAEVMDLLDNTERR